MAELTPRRTRILRRIVEEYVATAQPVPSEVIARKYENEVSSATVRNEMMALEEAGLVTQPHTSAGRIPTDLGYRVFVERMMSNTPAMEPAERRSIRKRFQHVADNADDSAHLASAVLASSLGSASMVTPPRASHARPRRIELVPLDDKVVLNTLILQSGVVRQIVQRLDHVVERDELTRLSNELSHLLVGKSPREAHRLAGKVIGAGREFALAAVRMLQQAEDQAFAAVYYEGIAQLLAQPEFAQSDKLRPILEVLEQQSLLARFLAESLANPGVQVIIGAENPLEQMRGAAMILTRYGGPDEPSGVLGVVGPTRLPYWRAVPLVTFVSELMGLLAEHRLVFSTPRQSTDEHQ